MLHGLHMRFDACAGPLVDHWPHVHRQMRGRSHADFGHRALQHGDQAVGHIVLYAQHTQGRAALTGRLKG